MKDMSNDSNHNEEDGFLIESDDPSQDHHHQHPHEHHQDEDDEDLPQLNMDSLFSEMGIFVSSRHSPSSSTTSTSSTLSSSASSSSSTSSSSHSSRPSFLALNCFDDADVDDDGLLADFMSTTTTATTAGNSSTSSSASRSSMRRSSERVPSSPSDDSSTDTVSELRVSCPLNSDPFLVNGELLTTSDLLGHRLDLASSSVWDSPPPSSNNSNSFVSDRLDQLGSSLDEEDLDVISHPSTSSPAPKDADGQLPQLRLADDFPTLLGNDDSIWESFINSDIGDIMMSSEDLLQETPTPPEPLLTPSVASPTTTTTAPSTSKSQTSTTSFDPFDQQPPPPPPLNSNLAMLLQQSLPPPSASKPKKKPRLTVDILSASSKSPQHSATSKNGPANVTSAQKMKSPLTPTTSAKRMFLDTQTSVATNGLNGFIIATTTSVDGKQRSGTLCAPQSLTAVKYNGNHGTKTVFINSKHSPNSDGHSSLSSSGSSSTSSSSSSSPLECFAIARGIDLNGTGSGQVTLTKPTMTALGGKLSGITYRLITTTTTTTNGINTQKRAFPSSTMARKAPSLVTITPEQLERAGKRLKLGTATTAGLIPFRAAGGLQTKSVMNGSSGLSPSFVVKKTEPLQMTSANNGSRKMMDSGSVLMNLLVSGEDVNNGYVRPSKSKLSVVGQHGHHLHHQQHRIANR